MRQTRAGGPTISKALVYWFDADRRVIASREVEFTSRADLVRQLEPKLDHCSSVEAWQEDVLILRMNAHGQIDWRQ